MKVIIEYDEHSEYWDVTCDPPLTPYEMYVMFTDLAEHCDEAEVIKPEKVH